MKRKKAKRDQASTRPTASGFSLNLAGSKQQHWCLADLSSGIFGAWKGPGKQGMGQAGCEWRFFEKSFIKRMGLFFYFLVDPAAMTWE